MVNNNRAAIKNARRTQTSPIALSGKRPKANEKFAQNPYVTPAYTAIVSNVSKKNLEALGMALFSLSNKLLKILNARDRYHSFTVVC
jgi:hypothetical protein